MPGAALGEGDGVGGKENVKPETVVMNPLESTASSRTDRVTILPQQPRRIKIPVDSTFDRLLQQEDTDENGLITVDDTGPKEFRITTAGAADDSGQIKIRGNYQLACLLQELFFARQRGHETLELILPDQEEENPGSRLRRFIQHHWWDNITRRLDANGIEAAAPDPKTTSNQPRIYIPAECETQYTYYKTIAALRPHLNLDVQWLPKGEVDPEFVKSLNTRPGILALELGRDEQGQDMSAQPFIVPGGRFNELYNWDSVFAAWGLLDSHPHIVKSIIRNFIFEIKHYGKILNANRSYYLGRSQPPLLTDLALRTYEARKEADPGAKELLRDAILAAIKEYKSWWMTPPRYDPATGLNRYRPIGSGFPPECEPTHFDHVLAPYAKKYDMTIAEVMQAYNDGSIAEPDLDTFCLHDRAVRESGHDVSRRVEGVCADLGIIDLNFLLYKYERDIAHAISTHFEDRLHVPKEFSSNSETIPDPTDVNGQGNGLSSQDVETSSTWLAAAERRKATIDKYLWNEEAGMYFDFNTRTHKTTTYESVTTLWALWSGAASPHQASKLVSHALPRFECRGGLSVGTESSRGVVDPANGKPQMQWDFPFGWPPHQMLAWEGLKKYGFEADVERCVYRWLHMLVGVFVDFNGTVVEKYDVATTSGRPHRVDAEYGNQGLNFKYAPQEGFGWTNGSVIFGTSLLSPAAIDALGRRLSWEDYVQESKGNSSHIPASSSVSKN